MASPENDVFLTAKRLEQENARLIGILEEIVSMNPDEYDRAKISEFLISRGVGCSDTIHEDALPIQRAKEAIAQAKRVTA